jgi:K+-sensing histidine kinase KdpD
MLELLEFYGRDAAKRKSVDLKIELKAPSETVLPTSSPILLHGVLGNLLHNAIKFSPQDSVIEIRCRSQGSGLVIEIADQGDGLPGSVRYAFQDRAPSPTSSLGTAGEPGSGIGLWNAFEMARRIQCDLQLLPREPNGTIAQVYIPLNI